MAASAVKCRRTYMTVPVPGFSASEPVRVLRRATHLPDGYFIVRLLRDDPADRRIAMHESHLGAEVPS